MRQAKSSKKPQSSPDLQDVDIAIVGGGMIGLSMALSLAQSLREAASSAVSIVLIDAQPEAESLAALNSNDASFDPRVSALTVASEHLLSTLGAWNKITSIRACPYSEMFVWDADGTGSIHFTAADIQESRLGHIVENRLVTTALNEALMAQENVEIIKGESLSGFTKKDIEKGTEGLNFNPSVPFLSRFPGHELRFESGRELNCKLLIAADGGNSFIRREAGFTSREWDYQHQAIVTTVKTEKPHNFTATQCFMPSGPLAFLPLLNPGSKEAEQQNVSSIVWSCVPEKAEELMKLNDEEFALALGEAFEYRFGKIVSSQQRFSFPLTQRHAKDYVQDGIALIGDAAHTIHPLAGQGVNLGLLDVAALTEVITSALAKGEDFPSRQTLSRYQRQRKAGNLSMMLAMEGFKRLFASEDLSLRWLRNLGMSGVNTTPVIKNHLMKKAMGI